MKTKTMIILDALLLFVQTYMLCTVIYYSALVILLLFSLATGEPTLKQIIDWV